MTTVKKTNIPIGSRKSAQPLNAAGEVGKYLHTGAAATSFPNFLCSPTCSTPISQRTFVFRIVRWLSPLLVCLVLSGCSNLHMLNLSATEESKVFVHGLDQYIKSRDLTTLKLLPKDYPPGEWRTRAEGLIEIAEQNKLFAQGVDLYIKSRKLTTLKLLTQKYPEGEWRANAEGLIEIDEQDKLFAQGVDLYIKSSKLTTLKLLTKKYPKGEWRARAEGLIDIAEQHQQQQDRLEKQHQELAHTQQEKEVLFEDNKILEVTLERLKQVLIDMELRKE